LQFPKGKQQTGSFFSQPCRLNRTVNYPLLKNSPLDQADINLSIRSVLPALFKIIHWSLLQQMEFFRTGHFVGGPFSRINWLESESLPPELSRLCDAFFARTSINTKYSPPSEIAVETLRRVARPGFTLKFPAAHLPTAR